MPLVRFASALLLGLAWAAANAASPWDDARSVSRAQIVAALREQQAQGYRLDTIANSVRMQVGVFFALADAGRAADPQQRPLRVAQRDWFAAWLEVTGLTADTAPAYITVPHRHGEDYLIDYRLEEVLDLAATRDRPARALNVKAGWPAAPGAPASYSYEDRSTDPAIETTHQQVSSFRVLDFGQAIVYDEIRGVTGRATSGLLGAIFSLLGHATAQQTRFAIASDGMQVSRTTARKGFTLTQAITISPDGRVLTGLPENRPDLQDIDRLLAQLPLRVTYRPIDLSPLRRPLRTEPHPAHRLRRPLCGLPAFIEKPTEPARGKKTQTEADRKAPLRPKAPTGVTVTTGPPSRRWASGPSCSSAARRGASAPRTPGAGTRACSISSRTCSTAKAARVRFPAAS